MKSLTPLVLLAIILSCSSRNNQETEQIATAHEQVIEPELQELPVSVDTVPEPEKDIVETKSTSIDVTTELKFAHKSFFLTSDYDLTNCDALARCDCCTSEIYFKNDSVYVYSSGCGGTTSYTKGTYYFNNETLTLQHDSLLVINRQPFGDDEDDSELGISKEIRYIKPTNYLIEECDDQVLLHWKGKTSNEYGREEFQRNSLLYIIGDANSEITQNLELTKADNKR